MFSALNILEVNAAPKSITQAQALKMLLAKVPYEKQTKFRCYITKFDVKKNANKCPKVMLGKSFFTFEDNYAEDVPPIYYVDRATGKSIFIYQENFYSQLAPVKNKDLRITKIQAIEAVKKHIGESITSFYNIKINQVENIEFTNEQGRCYSVYAVRKSDKLKYYYDVNVYSGKIYDSFNEP
jgi:ribosomal protein L23